MRAVVMTTPPLQPAGSKEHVARLREGHRGRAPDPLSGPYSGPYSYSYSGLGPGLR